MKQGFYNAAVINLEQKNRRKTKRNEEKTIMRRSLVVIRRWRLAVEAGSGDDQTLYLEEESRMRRRRIRTCNNL